VSSRMAKPTHPGDLLVVPSNAEVFLFEDSHDFGPVHKVCIVKGSPCLVLEKRRDRFGDTAVRVLVSGRSGWWRWEDPLLRWFEMNHGI